MKTYLDCIPCFFKQALEAARIAGVSEKKQKKILDEVALALPKLSLSSSPPEVGRIIYGVVRKVSGRVDPYAEIKRKSNAVALGIYSKLKKKIGSAPDKLLMAVELAIAGNVIDYGVKNSLDVGAEVAKILAAENRVIKKEKKAIFD